MDVSSLTLVEALESMPRSEIITDSDGFILYINPAASDLSGYSPKEALGLSIFRFFPENNITGFEESSGKTGKVKSNDGLISNGVWYRTRVLRKDDGFKDVMLFRSTVNIADEVLSHERKGKPLYLYSITDISQFRIAGPSLDDEVIRFLISAIADIREGVVVTDLKGTIIYTNQFVQELLGYSVKGLSGKNIVELFHPGDTDKLSREVIENIIDMGLWEGEVGSVTRDGIKLHVRLKLSILTDDNGKAISILGIVSDISEEVEMRTNLLHSNRELSALYSVSTALSDSIEMERLLSTSLTRVLNVMEMDMGLIRILDEETNELVLRTHVGVSDSYRDKYSKMSVDGSVSGHVMRTGEPHLSSRDNLDDSSFQAVLMTEGLFQTIVVPLRSKDRIMGTLSAGSYNRRESIPQDIKLLSSIGSLIGVAVENSLIFEHVDTLAREKEIMVDELSLLQDLSHALMTTIQLDKLLYTVLTAVTIGESFGFNRGVLFLVDEDSENIVLRMGIGPTNAEEAGKIWNELTEKNLDLFDTVKKGFEEYSSQEAREKRAHIRIKLPLNHKNDVVVRSIIENEPVIITDALTNPNVDESMLGLLTGSNVFACVPIVALDKPLGAILVDNAFNNKPIHKEDIALLWAFANQAGLAIQNSILYTKKEKINRELREAQAKLLQQAKMVGLGEMASEIAHEIRNPLVSVGGFARKISKIAGKDKRLKIYSDIVIKEVMKLENTLTNILSVHKEIPPNFSVVDLNSVISDTMSLVRDDLNSKGISLDMELEESLPEIEADAVQLRQVFLNLFYNAIHAMEKGGVLEVKTSTEKMGKLFFIRAEVSDTGKGVPIELLGDIFKPFFTTKSTGIGLGLAITHQIVSNHGGNIDIINRAEGGATFVVELPLIQG